MATIHPTSEGTTLCPRGTLADVLRTLRFFTDIDSTSDFDSHSGEVYSVAVQSFDQKVKVAEQLVSLDLFGETVKTHTTVETHEKSFLASVYHLAANDGDREGILVVFRFVNDLLSDGQLPACDEILRDVNVGKLTDDLMLSFLTITRAARTELKYRPGYIQRVRQRLRENRDEEDVEELLAPLV